MELSATGTGTTGAVGCASDAVAEYEKLLAAASRLIIHRMPSKRPVVAAMALEVDGVRGALIIDVNIDAKGDNRGDLRNIPPFGAFRTEIKLGDGRVVMNVGARGTMGYIEFFTARRDGVGPSPVQVMDREGPMSLSYEYDKHLHSSYGLLCLLCDPLVAISRTRITHPQSVDDMMRHGYQLIASWRVNGHRKCFDACIICCAAFTCCSGPACLSCCILPPVVHYELQELFHADGRAVEGVRYSEHGKTCCAQMRSSAPDGDVVQFVSTTPLHVRKDMIAMAAYRASVLVTTPDTA